MHIMIVYSNSNNVTKQNRKRKRSNNNDVYGDTYQYNLTSTKNKQNLITVPLFNVII